ncbi:MAG: PDZ domain-containing protein [Chthoniobacterales bacterium]
MALQLNLLHEQFTEERQRQRDPLKIGIMVLAGLAGLLVLYYMWSAYQTLHIKARLAALERDWEKVEPKVTAAQKRMQELNGIINATRVLDDHIDGRFFWAPLLERIAGCVAPNTQLTSLNGSADPNKGVDLVIDGFAAGREPRAVAEDLRQMLIEQLGQNSLGIQPQSQPKNATPSETEEIVVEEVAQGSPAQQAQVQPGDRIRKIDNREIMNIGDLSDLSAQLELGKKINLEVQRKGKSLKLSTEIRERRADYKDVKVEFRSLEEVDQIAMIGGTHMPMARYTLAISFKAPGQFAAVGGRAKK